jgi:uncharacterized protein YceK
VKSTIIDNFAHHKKNILNMKKVIVSLALVAMAAFVFVGCGSKSDPKEVANNYLSALTKMDYVTAKKYCTEKNIEMLDMMASFTGAIPDSMKNKTKESKITITNVKEEGDNATVTFTTSDKPGDNTLKMVKKDGKWLANQSKEDNMSGQKIDAPAPTEETVPMDSVKKTK